MAIKESFRRAKRGGKKKPSECWRKRPNPSGEQEEKKKRPLTRGGWKKERYLKQKEGGANLSEGERGGSHPARKKTERGDWFEIKREEEGKFGQNKRKT